MTSANPNPATKRAVLWVQPTTHTELDSRITCRARMSRLSKSSIPASGASWIACHPAPRLSIAPLVVMTAAIYGDGEGWLHLGAAAHRHCRARRGRRRAGRARGRPLTLHPQQPRPAASRPRALSCGTGGARPSTARQVRARRAVDLKNNSTQCLSVGASPSAKGWRDRVATACARPGKIWPLSTDFATLRSGHRGRVGNPDQSQESSSRGTSSGYFPV